MERTKIRLVEVRIGWDETFEPSCLRVPWDTSLREVVWPLLPLDVEAERVWGTDGTTPGDALDRTGRQFPDRARVLLLESSGGLGEAQQAWLQEFDFASRSRLAVDTYDPRVQGIHFEASRSQTFTEALAKALGGYTACVTYMTVTHDGKLLVLGGRKVFNMSPQEDTVAELQFLKDQPKEEPYLFQAPQFITTGLDDHYYLIDAGRLRCFDRRSRKHLGQRQHSALLGPVLRQPRRLAFLRTGEILVVDGTVLLQYAPGQQQGMPVPLSDGGRRLAITDMVARSDGSLLVADATAGAVYLWCGWGQEVCQIYASPQAPDRLLLALDWRERLYILSADTCRVHVFDRDGTALCSFGSKGREAYQLFSPSAIAVDAAMRLFVSDGAMLKVFAVVYAGEALPVETSRPEPAAAPATDREGVTHEVATYDYLINMQGQPPCCISPALRQGAELILRGTADGYEQLKGLFDWFLQQEKADTFSRTIGVETPEGTLEVPASCPESKIFRFIILSRALELPVFLSGLFCVWLREENRDVFCDPSTGAFDVPYEDCQPLSDQQFLHQVLAFTPGAGALAAEIPRSPEDATTPPADGALPGS
jgi:hypothetical protein